MPLVWRGPGWSPCFFKPDRIGQFGHDAPDDANMVLTTADGTPICGRVVDGATRRWTSALEPGWVWEP